MESSQVDTLDKNQGSKFLQKWKAFEWKKLYRLKKKLEIGLVLTLIFIVWGLLSLPIIFYHLPVEQVSYIQSKLEVLFDFHQQYR